MCSAPSTPRDPDWQDLARRAAAGIRRRVLAHTLYNNGGYLSQACSSAEILATLYTRVMHLGPSTAPLMPRPFPGVPGPDNPLSFTGAGYNGPKAPDKDRFVFSPLRGGRTLCCVCFCGCVGRLWCLGGLALHDALGWG